MHIGIRYLTKLTVLMVFSITVKAAPIWGSDASGNLMGSRTYDATAANDGLTVSTGWQASDPAFSISWDITQDTGTGLWTYVYTVNSSRPAISHMLLEITDISDIEGASFDAFEGSDALSEDSPKTWVGGSGNPGLPNSLYGVKFDFGDDGTETYTLITDRAPEWGVFYAKGGNDDYAYSSALDFSDYQTNLSLTITDFIVRPDGDSLPDTQVPLPAALWLFGPALIGLIGISRKRH